MQEYAKETNTGIPPYRRLRKPPRRICLIGQGIPPYRRLRNADSWTKDSGRCIPPYRRLRNLHASNDLIVMVFRRIGGLEIFLNDDQHFYEQVKKTVQAPTESSIIGSMNGLEEAKKRDKKIQITDIAIQKVREVKVPGFSEVQNANLQYAHKQLLEYALKQNNSNEVMGMTSLAFDGVLYSKGTTEFVGVTPQMNSYMLHLPIGNGVIMHNHPATRPFSFMDIGYFISKSQIGVITIVSNQGNVHILRKQDNFSTEMCIDYLKQLRIKYNDDFDAIVRDFLRNCRKVGIIYVKD